MLGFLLPLQVARPDFWGDYFHLNNIYWKKRLILNIDVLSLHPRSSGGTPRPHEVTISISIWRNKDSAYSKYFKLKSLYM